MTDALFMCPCCGNETEVAFTVEEVAERFSGPMRDLIDLLSIGRWKTRDALFQALYGHRVDGGPESFNVISVRMSQLNKRLRPFGYEVTSKLPSGDTAKLVYRLAPIIQGGRS
jgi:hypothetical protein